MSETISMACVGDVMCGDSFYNLGQGCASVIKKYKSDFLDKEIAVLFHRHDIVFGNMESPISDHGKNSFSLRSLHMRASSEVAPLLSQWGFTVFNVANNHILEHGRQAAIETVEHLERQGIVVVGVGEQGFESSIQIKKIKVRDAEIIFMALCLKDEKYAFSGGCNTEEFLETITKYCIYGPVIVSVHWGNEFIDRPADSIKFLGRAMIDCGATAVIGHHPHVVQGIEQYKDGLIAYSLGNFIFDSFDPECRWSLILSLEIKHKKVCKWNYYPIMLDYEHRPCLTSGADEKQKIKEIQRRCDVLKFEQGDDYAEKVRVYEQQNRKLMKKHLLRNVLKMSPVFWPQILLRPIQRRLGVW